MSKRRRDIETGSLSFLDVICCGFGAVILLLVITKIFEPIRLEESHVELEGLIARYQQELEEILGETDIVTRERLATIAQTMMAQRPALTQRRQPEKRSTPKTAKGSAVHTPRATSFSSPNIRFSRSNGSGIPKSSAMRL